MKTVKFIGDDPAQKEFGHAVRRNVHAYFKAKDLSTKGGVRMIGKAFLILGIYLIPFVLLLVFPVGIWAALALVIVMGIGEAGVGMGVMHDAVHGAFSEKKWVNEVFGFSMYAMGSNTFNWKIQHNLLHHTFTNIEGMDEDIETKAVIRLCEHTPLKKYHRFQYLYAYFLYGLMTLSKFVTDIAQLIDFNRTGITREQHKNPRLELFKLVLTKIIYLFVVIGLPLWFTSYAWWQILIGFCLMHVTAGIIMSTVFQMAHVVEGTEQPLPDNKGVVHNEWAVHELHTTSDFGRHNLLLNWYVGGLNFQIEHHLFPHTCHLHYRKIAPIVQQTALEFGIPYNLKPSLRAAFISHTKRLRALGRPLNG
ncbi:MAG TPA: acyl-CoA desaturase [Bacteroidia bacterium]|nr:acyl-CoA desaturase [Bacteroidia bacterium]